MSDIERREWWAVVTPDGGQAFGIFSTRENAEKYAATVSCVARRVIAAPSESEVEAARACGIDDYLANKKSDVGAVCDAITAAIRKLLGGGE